MLASRCGQMGAVDGSIVECRVPFLDRGETLSLSAESLDQPAL